MRHSQTDAQSFPLASIKTHPDLQIRGGTDFLTVKRYAQAMQRGDDFPAVSLAEVGGNLYIIDGHHRYDAALAAGKLVIKATKRRMSLREARSLAFTVNQDHGRRLTNKEKQHAFAAYIASGLHLNDEERLDVLPGTVKTLRAIAAECPVYDFRTIGKKLKERGINVPRDTVKPFLAHETYPTDGIEPEDLELEQTSLLRTFKERLGVALSSYGIMDARRQREVRTILRMHVEALDDDTVKTQHQPLEI